MDSQFLFYSNKDTSLFESSDSDSDYAGSTAHSFPDFDFASAFAPTTTMFGQDDLYNEGPYADMTQWDSAYVPPSHSQQQTIDPSMLAPEPYFATEEAYSPPSPSPAPSPAPSEYEPSGITHPAAKGVYDVYDSDSNCDSDDDDAEGDSDDDSGEFRPSPSPAPRSARLPPLSQRSSYRNAYNNIRRSNSAASSSSRSSSISRSSSPANPSSPRYRTTHPRHVQFGRDVNVEALMRQVRDWQCPHPNCLYVQKNGRKPDFRRHVQTHLRNNNDPTWICCGKPVGPNDPRWDSAREWNGYRMFGGCWQTFSRRDALKRHLKNANNSCIGEMDGHWMPKHCRK